MKVPYFCPSWDFPQWNGRRRRIPLLCDMAAATMERGALAYFRPAIGGPFACEVPHASSEEACKSLSVAMGVSIEGRLELDRPGPEL